MKILYTGVNHERGVPTQGYANTSRNIDKAIKDNTGELGRRAGSLGYLDSIARMKYREDESLATWNMASAMRNETIA